WRASSTEDAGDIEKYPGRRRETTGNKAAEAASLVTAEGVVASIVGDDDGALVELNCEADDVAKSDDVHTFAKRVAVLGANVFADALKSSFFAAKSVSRFSSTSAPTCSPTNYTTTPSAVTVYSALLSLLPSFTITISSAFSMSPSASVITFFHSIIGSSVFARSSSTMLALITSLILSFILYS
ncbi:hypothetical protein OIV58_31710, partial [Burkholderia pseudomallei]|nr:hypothetical protein [Burkholderia pseudomallei]